MAVRGGYVSDPRVRTKERLRSCWEGRCSPRRSAGATRRTPLSGRRGLEERSSGVEGSHTPGVTPGVCLCGESCACSAWCGKASPPTTDGGYPAAVLSSWSTDANSSRGRLDPNDERCGFMAPITSDRTASPRPSRPRSWRCSPRSQRRAGVRARRCSKVSKLYNGFLLKRRFEARPRFPACFCDVYSSSLPNASHTSPT